MEDEFKVFLTDESTRCSDYQFIHVLRGALADSFVENRIYLWGDDIEDAIEIIYPILSNIVFNVHVNIRHDAKTINDLIKFLLTRIA